MTRRLLSLPVLENKATVEADWGLNYQAVAFGLKAAFDMGKVSIDLFFRLVDCLREFPCSLWFFCKQADDLAANCVAFDIQKRHDRSTRGIGFDGDWL